MKSSSSTKLHANAADLHRRPHASGADGSDLVRVLIGRWDGDVLVVETAGLNDKAWLDDGGHPRSDQMRTTEKFRRKDFGHMEIEFTFNDSKAYTAPWTVTVPFELLPDTDIIENICENEKDVVHIFGK
jgi:hypothetical protein